MPWMARAQEDFSYGVGIGFDFSRDAYEADLNFTYYPVQTFGVRLSLGAAGEYRKMFYDIDDYIFGDDYPNYYDDYDRNYTWRFKFSPSIELRTPTLVKFGSGSGLHLFANPGITLSPGAEGSHDAKWFTWQVRGGLEFEFNLFAVQVGYRCTNFYLYSGNPWSNVDYEFDRDLYRDKYTHSGFISFVMRF